MTYFDIQMDFLLMEFGPKQFRKSGEILFGSQWQKDLSKALGMKSTRRIREWVSGNTPLPPFLRDDIMNLLKDRKKKLEEFIGSIEE